MQVRYCVSRYLPSLLVQLGIHVSPLLQMQSQEVWRLLMLNVVNIPPLAWNALTSNLFHPSSMNICRNKEFKCRLSSIAYYIWPEQNYKKFEASSLSPSMLVNMAHSALL